MPSPTRLRQIQRSRAKQYTSVIAALRKQGFTECPEPRDLGPELSEMILTELQQPCTMVKTGDDATPLRAFTSREGRAALDMVIHAWRIVNDGTGVRGVKGTCTALARIFNQRPTFRAEFQTAYHLGADDETLWGILAAELQPGT